MARIGITCTIDEDGGFGLFSNNLRQTAFFLYRMFKKAGHAAVLLTGPESKGPTQQLLSFGIEPTDIVAVGHDLDLVIVCSRGLGSSEHTHYKIDFGAKVVRYMQSNLGIDTCAAFVGGDQLGSETFVDHGYYDAIWMTPNLVPTFRSWCHTVYGCDVHTVPPVWEPLFLPNQFDFDQVQPNPDGGMHGWRAGIIDAGNTMTRTAHFPLMALWSATQNPDPNHTVCEISIMNGERLKGNTHFRAFLDRLGFHEANKKVKTWLLPGMVRPILFRDRCDLIVSHDIDDGLDYAYFEALWGGYPLIHCSEYLSAGYKYNRYDIGGAGLQIRQAMLSHDSRAARDQFRTSALKYLQDYARYEVLL